MTEKEEENIIKENLWLIEYVARKYKHYAEWSDMISAGRYGLVRGVRKYNPKKGKASTYLIHWVRAEIMKFLYENRNVHLPWNRINKYIKEREKTNFTDGIYPRFEISLDKNTYMVDDCDDYDPSNLEINSSLSSEFTHNLSVKENNDHILFLFNNSNLTQMEKNIIIHRFGLYGENRKTLKDVGDIIGYSAMGVQKIEKKALKKLSKISSFKEAREIFNEF